MTVRKILARKGRRVFTIKSNATLAAAANLFSRRRVGALVVAREGVSGGAFPLRFCPPVTFFVSI